MGGYLEGGPVGTGSGPASAAYGRMRVTREPFLIRARRQSRLTIPGLFREYGENQTTGETIPWQSLGSYGVNNLAAKIVMAMFPPGIPNINLKPTKKVLQGFAQMDPDARGSLKDAIDKGLSGVEMEYVDACEEDGDRAKHFDAVRHMIVGGNHALKVNPENQVLQSKPLEQYVVRRDASGTVLEAVLEDPMAWESLPEDCQALCKQAGYKEPTEENPDGGGPICVYTHIRLVNGKYNLYQECWGQKVPGSQATYNIDALPWLFLRMIALEGEDYGRSYCEDYEGDLQTYDGFWQILTEGSAAIAQLKWLVKPGGVTNKKAFAEAPNGAVLTGDPDDVAAVRSEHQGDLQTAFQVAEKIEQRLEKVFLIFTQRSGERVTALEIQKVIQELQEGLGGVYSNQVTTYQAPLARLKLDALQRAGRITQLPKGTTKVTIISGDAALGRMQKAQTLDEFMQTSIASLGPTGGQIIAPYVKVGAYLSRGAANRGIDTDGLIKTDDEVTQEQQQQQAATLSQTVAPEVVKQGGQMLQNLQTGQAVDPNAPPAQAAPPQQQQPQPQGA